ncbi:MAG: PDZ domain-containing protein [Verrucomicrobia bacterium]|nr:PDZ domain-containing protein [Verrucomicrobiota bacterium]
MTRLFPGRARRRPRWRDAALLAVLVLPFAPLPAATPEERDPMLARVFPSIVRIEAIRLRPTDGRLTKEWSGGSGVVISAEGHVLTNCHVTEDGDFFRGYLHDGSQLEAVLVGQDPLTDLAVIRLNLAQRAAGAPPLPVARFGDSAALRVGEEVFALGSPGFLAQSVTQGVVSNPSLVLPEQTVGKMMLRGEDVGQFVRWVLHDARIFGGNSGGPLVNTRGEVVGINEIGVVGLSGAIPSNLAREVARQLMTTGKVVRGWSGLTVQRRLEASGKGSGVVVGDVAEGSPAAAAGFLPGDVILACDGQPIEGAEEKAVAHFHRLEASRVPGEDLEVRLARDGAEATRRVRLVAREAARADDVEFRTWGAVMRDLTQRISRLERLPDTRGVWLENVRPAGPAGQAEPVLRRGDVLIAVEGRSVEGVAELRRMSEELLRDAPKGVRTVLAEVRRDGARLSSVLELRAASERNFPPQARRAWLGVSSQPLTPKLSARLGIKAEGGARLTRIYPGTQAETGGLQVGDVLLALDGTPVAARRPEDTDVLARQVRQYRAGSAVQVSLWREGVLRELTLVLEEQPIPAAEMAWWEDVQLEFSARELAFDDRIRLQLTTAQTGALVESAFPAGWAALAGLRADDLIEAAAGQPVTSLAELRSSRAAAVDAKRDWWVLRVRRRGQTLLVEISLKPALSPR